MAPRTSSRLRTLVLLAPAAAVLIGVFPWSGPYNTGGELHVHELRQFQENAWWPAERGLGWLPLSRWLEAALLERVDADPLPRPTALRVAETVLLGLLALFSVATARSVLADRSIPVCAGALVLASPLALLAAAHLQAWPVLLAALLSLLASWCWVAAARRHWWLMLPALPLSVAALLAHPAALGLPFAVLSLLLLARTEEGQPLKPAWCLPALLLCVAWPFISQELGGATDPSGIGAVLPASRHQATWLLADQLHLSGLPGLVAGGLLLVALLGLRPRALRPAARLLLAGFAALAAGALPWGFVEPGIGVDRSLAFTGFLACSAAPVALWLVAALGCAREARPSLLDPRLACLMALTVASSGGSWLLLDATNRGARVRRAALDDVVGVAGTLPEMASIILLAPGGVRDPGARSGLDPFHSDLGFALALARPGSTQRLLHGPPLETTPLTPGMLQGITWTPGRDAVLAYHPGIDGEIRPLRRIDAALAARAAPVPHQDDGGARLTWEFSDALQAYSWTLPLPVSASFENAVWTGTDDSGLQRYRVGKEPTGGFHLPLAILGQGARPRALVIVGSALDAAGGTPGVVSIGGIPDLSVPVVLAQAEGSVRVELGALMERARKMSSPPDLLLIPCGAGGEIGIRRISMEIDS